MYTKNSKISFTSCRWMAKWKMYCPMKINKFWQIPCVHWCESKRYWKITNFPVDTTGDKISTLKIRQNSKKGQSTHRNEVYFAGPFSKFWPISHERDAAPSKPQTWRENEKKKEEKTLLWTVDDTEQRREMMDGKGRMKK